MGAMKADSQSEGTTPYSSEWLENADRGSDKGSASSLSTLARMLFGPDALRTFSERWSLENPAADTCR